MGRITTDQSHQVMATLAVNTDWSQIDFKESGLQELIVRRPQEAGRRFTAFLKAGARIFSGKFPILMTVKLGTGLKTANDFRQAFKTAGLELGSSIIDLLALLAFSVADQPTEVSVVAPTVAELGFEKGARYTDICQRGVELMGYKLCPPELGPQMRLQYMKQSKDEVLWLATEDIRDSDNFQYTFLVGNYGCGLWLRASDVRPGSFFDAGTRFVFVCR